MQTQLPFAMDPVVYDFEINDRGSWATLLQGQNAAMSDSYYAMVTPKWLKRDIRDLSEQNQRELIRVSQQIRTGGTDANWLLERILPQVSQKNEEQSTRLKDLLNQNGFDREQHEQIRTELLNGRLGLSQNRLPPQTSIQDVAPDDVVDFRNNVDSNIKKIGEASIANGEIAVVNASCRSR